MTGLRNPLTVLTFTDKLCIAFYAINIFLTITVLQFQIWIKKKVVVDLRRQTKAQTHSYDIQMKTKLSMNIYGDNFFKHNIKYLDKPIVIELQKYPRAHPELALVPLHLATPSITIP